MGIGRATISYWRKGNTPKSDILDKIAEYFGVSVDYLLGKTNEKIPLADDDAELSEILYELKNREDMKMLFSISKGCTKEEIMQAVKIIEALRKKDE